MSKYGMVSELRDLEGEVEIDIGGMTVPVDVKRVHGNDGVRDFVLGDVISYSDVVEDNGVYGGFRLKNVKLVDRKKVIERLEDAYQHTYELFHSTVKEDPFFVNLIDMYGDFLDTCVLDDLFEQTYFMTCYREYPFIIFSEQDEYGKDSFARLCIEGAIDSFDISDESIENVIRVIDEVGIDFMVYMSTSDERRRLSSEDILMLGRSYNRAVDSGLDVGYRAMDNNMIKLFVHSRFHDYKLFIELFGKVDFGDVDITTTLFFGK